MIYAFILVDTWVLARLIHAAINKRFTDICIKAGVVIFLSPYIVNFVFNAVIRCYLGSTSHH